jgi:hydrogenase nickel incorporation protein HypA/HybF
MHELGLCEGIVEATARHAGGRRVLSMRVRVSGHQVDPEVIRQGVELAAINTVVEGAVLDLVLEPLIAHCRDCGHDSGADGPLGLAACPECGGVDITLACAEQIVLESISVAAPTATPAKTPGQEART